MQLNKFFIKKMLEVWESAGGSLAVMTELISGSERLQELFDVPKLNVDIGGAGINCGIEF